MAKKKTAAKKKTTRKKTATKAKTKTAGAKKKSAKKRPGLWANIHAKHKRIEGGSGEKMRKAGDKGAPTSKSIQNSQRTSKK